MTTYRFTIDGRTIEKTKNRRINALSVLGEIIKECNFSSNGTATLKINDEEEITFTYSKTNNVVAIVKKMVRMYL